MFGIYIDGGFLRVYTYNVNDGRNIGLFDIAYDRLGLTVF